jgi:hypothetical protein
MTLFINDFKRWLNEDETRKQGLEWEEFFTKTKECFLGREIYSSSNIYNLNTLEDRNIYSPNKELKNHYFISPNHIQVLKKWVGDRVDKQGYFYLNWENINEIEKSKQLIDQVKNKLAKWTKLIKNSKNYL